MAPSEDPRGLVDFCKFIGQLSEHRCLAELQALITQVSTLQAQLDERDNQSKLQEATLLAKADEVAQLRLEHQNRHQEIIDAHAGLLTKKDNEKEELRRALTEQGTKLNQSTTSAQQLEETVHELRAQARSQEEEMKKIEITLQQAQAQHDRIRQSLKEHKELSKSKDVQIQAGKKSSVQILAQKTALEQECNKLRDNLQVSDQRLARIDELIPPLLSANREEITGRFQQLWQYLLRLGQACFDEDNPLENLQHAANWQSYTRSHLVTHQTPQPPTNTPAARRMRLTTTVAILADALTRYLFTSTHLFNDTKELDKLLWDVDDINNDKKVTWRLSRIRDCMNEHVSPLLSAEQLKTMNQHLDLLLKVATELWTYLCRQSSYFAVNTKPRYTNDIPWKSLVWDVEKSIFREEDTTSMHETVSVLFPQILALDGDAEHNIFNGVVLLQSEVVGAWAELEESSAAPSAVRSVSRRAGGGRPKEIVQRTRTESFLVREGGPRVST